MACCAERTDMRGTDYAELVALVAVAEECNFRRAAERLGLSPSALSRAIGSLEGRLGARLLNRTTRSVAPTEAGSALLARIGPALAEIEGAVRDAGASQHRLLGRVRLNLPRVAARLVLAPLLGRFVERHPGIQLDIVVDDGITDIVAAGFDAGVRSGEMVHKDMVAVRLTPDLRMCVVGSPDYFEGRSQPATPVDLGEHLCIAYRWSETGALQRWRFDGPRGPFDVQVEAHVAVNETDLLLTAALGGAGLACLPEELVSPHIANGRLIEVLATWCRPVGGFHLYYPRRPMMPIALRAFVDFLVSPGERNTS